jgi:ubiquinone/menaquinone biosynthesis C-methylase UbiE
LSTDRTTPNTNEFGTGSIDKLNAHAEKLGLQNRVNGIVGSMNNLPFQNAEFDLIWSEGAIANIGFEKDLNYWKDFLKKDGYIAVTYESWFTDERPAEIEKRLSRPSTAPGEFHFAFLSSRQ